MDIPLDIQGQNPRLSRLYTQLCFCFPLPETTPSTQDNVVKHFQSGLERFFKTFPWVSGQVVRGLDGVYKIVPLEEAPKVVVNDLRIGLPSFQDMKEHEFPSRHLDESLIASKKTLPSDKDESAAEVFSTQLNFVEGGVLLVISTQHNCMDIRTMSQMTGLFAKACSGIEYEAREVARGNARSTEDDKMFLRSWRPWKERDDKKGKKEYDISESSWSYISFPASSIEKLKAEAMATIRPGSSYVTTDDVLSAFLWQAITRARSERVSGASLRSLQTTFERQVDVRKHFGLPISYNGNCVFKVESTCFMKEVIDSSIGHIASRLREEIREDKREDLAYRAQLANNYLRDQLKDDKHKTVSAASRPKVSSFDIKMSSWAKEKFWDLDFGGVLGRAESVRRPSFEAWEGLCYLLPRDSDGGVVAAVCLRSEDLEELKGDELVKQWARWVG